MAHVIIPIPGDGTQFEQCPTLTFTGGTRSSVAVTIRYRALPDSSRFGYVAFSGVLECRWIKSGLQYEDHTQHQEDRSPGLIEIVDSAYVTTMDMLGWQHQPGRLRNYKDPVRHFRMEFEKWGQLNVIATGIAVRTIDN